MAVPIHHCYRIAWLHSECGQASRQPTNALIQRPVDIAAPTPVHDLLVGSRCQRSVQQMLDEQWVVIGGGSVLNHRS